MFRKSGKHNLELAPGASVPPALHCNTTGSKLRTVQLKATCSHACPVLPVPGSLGPSQALRSYQRDMHSLHALHISPARLNVHTFVSTGLEFRRLMYHAQVSSAHV